MAGSRITTDAQILRNRHGTLPPPPTRNVSAWCFGVGMAMGWAVGLMCGLGFLGV